MQAFRSRLRRLPWRGFRWATLRPSSAMTFVLLICLILIALDGYNLWNARRQQLQANRYQTDNLARAIAQQAEGTLRTIDSIMIGLLERFAVDGLSPVALGRLRPLLVRLQTTLPMLQNLTVIGADGEVLVDSLPQSPSRNVADREYFQFHSTHPDRALHVGSPVRSRSTGEWVIPATYRINRPDGGFGGLVLASLDTNYFQRFYDTFMIGAQSSILLATADGFLLVRRPFSDANIGRDLRQGGIFRDLLPRAPAGNAIITSSTDGITRLNSYRRIDGYPLVIAAAVAIDEALADWNADVRNHLAGAAILVTIIVGLGLRLDGQIRQRATAEQTAAATADFYRLLADHSTDVIMRVQPDGWRSYVSPASMTLLGWSPAEMLGIRTGEMVHPDDRDAVQAAFAQVFAGAAGVIITCRWRCRDGRHIWVEATTSAIRDADGRITECVLAARNVDRRVAAEQSLAAARDAAEEATRTKSRFLASMSHEIRTPMNGVLGIAELLLDSPLTPEQRQRVTLLKDAGKSLLVILNDILDLSKIEAGKLTLEQAAFSPVAVIDGLVSLIRREADAKGLMLTHDLAPGLPEWVLGDPTRLRQILLNLLGNAIKFTERGRITIAVTQETGIGGKPGGGPHPERRLRFTVTDTGIGIPPNQQHLLFRNFSQIASTTHRFGGTGLGLVICKHLAEAMGGTIGMTSRPGTGSSFWFTIALVPAAAPQAEGPAPAAAPVTTGRILVVEDVAVNRMVIEAMLRAMGHQVVMAVDGAEALAAVSTVAEAGREAERFNLVLMDLQMPVMDGYEATRAIRRLGGWAAGLPILALTANAMAEDIANCRAAGMNDHLAKPIHRDNLLAMIAKWIDRREVSSALPGGTASSPFAVPPGRDHADQA